MRRDLREVIADWLILLGAVALLVALFLPWSRQRSAQDAWQVYSIVDGCLAGLGGGLALVAFLGGRARRLVVLIAAGVALAFAVHAQASPPTNGNLFDPAPARAGAGETVAIAALGVAIAGLALSFTAD